MEGLPVVRFNVSTGVDEKGQALNPATKGSGRALVFGGRAVVFNDNPRNKAWAQRVAWFAKAHQPAGGPWVGPVEIALAFRMRKPKSLPRDRDLPTVKPDLDKMIRSVKDALTGILYQDDAQIVRLTATKAYADDPGVEIWLTSLAKAEKEKK